MAVHITVTYSCYLYMILTLHIKWHSMF